MLNADETSVRDEHHITQSLGWLSELRPPWLWEATLTKTLTTLHLRMACYIIVVASRTQPASYELAVNSVKRAGFETFSVGEKSWLA